MGIKAVWHEESDMTEEEWEEVRIVMIDVFDRMFRDIILRRRYGLAYIIYRDIKWCVKGLFLWVKSRIS